MAADAKSTADCADERGSRSANPPALVECSLNEFVSHVLSAIFLSFDFPVVNSNFRPPISNRWYISRCSGPDFFLRVLSIDNSPCFRPFSPSQPAHNPLTTGLEAAQNGLRIGSQPAQTSLRHRSGIPASVYLMHQPAVGPFCRNGLMRCAAGGKQLPSLGSLHSLAATAFLVPSSTGRGGHRREAVVGEGRFPSSYNISYRVSTWLDRCRVSVDVSPCAARV